MARFGLQVDDEEEIQTPIASPIADETPAGEALGGVRMGANLLKGGASLGGLGYGAGILSGRRPAAQEAAAPKEQGDFSRGAGIAIDQTKQAYYGLKAVVGDAVANDKMRDEALEEYNRRGEEIAAKSKSSDSFTQAWADGDLIDWAQYGAGYVAAQAGMAIGTGGLGSVVGKMVARGAVKKGLEATLKKSIEKKIAAGLSEEAAVRSVMGTLGAGTALGAFNLSQELGHIYPDAVEQAAATGEDVSMLRVMGAATLAAALDTVTDAINIRGLGKAASGAKRSDKGLIRRVAQEAFVSGLREGGTELVQTGVERWGASKDLSSPEAIQDYIDSTALGLLGGGALGAAKGAVTRRPDPVAAPAPAAEEQPLASNPAPAVSTLGSNIEVTEEMRAKYAPDLQERGIDPVSPEADTAIRAMAAVEQASGVIRAREAEKEREERRKEVEAAFGQTATSGVGVGVGGAETMVRRESVVPEFGARILEPVDGAPEPVRLPETSWNDDGVSTPAISPEDVVARQEDWEAAKTFDVRDENGVGKTVGNRFVSQGQALKFLTPYALNTKGTQFQIREGRRAKSEGGGRYFFVEERPLENEAESDELIVGHGTRKDLTPKPKEEANAEPVGVQAGGDAAGAEAAPAPAPATESGAGPAPAPGPAAAPASAPAPAPKGAPAALTRNFGKKRVTFPDTDHVETFGLGRIAPQFTGKRAELAQAEQELKDRPSKKREAAVEKLRKEVAAMEAKVTAARARARKVFGKDLDDATVDQRAVEYNTQVRAHAHASDGSAPVMAKRGGEYTAKPEAQKVDQAGQEAENQPEEQISDAAGQPYGDDVRKALSGIQDRLRKRFGSDSIVLDIAPVPAGSAGAVHRAAAEIAQRFFGKRVVFVKFGDRPIFNGLFSKPHPDLIFVRVDSARPVGAVVGHELLHALRHDNPALYRDLVDQLKAFTKGHDKHEALLASHYLQAGAKALSTDVATEELHADIVGDFFTDPKFWEDFGERSPEKAQGVAAKVMELLSRIANVLREQFRPFGTEQYITDLEKARDVVAQAMAKYSEAEAETEVAALEPDVEEMLSASDNEKRLGHRSLASETAHSAADAPESDVGHRREKNGRYVGAPDWIGGSPQRLAVLRQNLRRLAAEGEPGRMWYENSSKAILDLAGGDRAEAEKIAALIAIYSPNATVAANTTMALNAYYQYKAGLPIKAGLGASNKKAEDLLRHNKPWGGIKTNSFYQNLMVEIDPSQLDESVATMDMWMALAFDYGDKKLDAGPKYKFSERETQRLAQELGWTAHQVQAAIWTAIKARVEGSAGPRKAWELKHGVAETVTETVDGKTTTTHQIVKGREYDHYRAATRFGMKHELDPQQIAASKYDFRDALEGRMVQISWEATPGASTGVLPGVLTAPLPQKAEYLQAIMKALTTPEGRDAIADLVGLPQGVTIAGLSAWQGDVGAGAQTFTAAAMGGSGKSRTFTPAAKQLLDTYAAAKGLILHQEAVVYHNAVYEDSAIRHNGAELKTTRPITPSEMELLYRALHERFGTWELAPGFRPDGVRVLNFVDGLSNKDFQAGFEEVVAGLPDDFGGGAGRLATFRSEGNYIYNDWQENPSGEGYKSQIAAGRPDLQRGVAELRARVAAVNEDFSARYGWGNPGPSAEALRAESEAVSDDGDLLSIADALRPPPAREVSRPGWDEATTKALNEPFNPAPALPIKQRLQTLRHDFLRRFTAAVVDPFVGLKEMSDELYMRARLTNGTDGGLESLLHYGQIYDDGGALNVRKGTKGLLTALQPLGAEVEDFFRWVALNRAAQLKKQDREHYFTDASIALRHKLVEGNMADGRNRAQVYQQALADMNALNKSVLDLAFKSGLIDKKGYDRFSKDIWYVPFYRVAEESDNDVTAFQAASGLSGQNFGKHLKGGTDRVDALLPNLLRNWGSLLTAAQKNAVARDALVEAQQMGAARQVKSGTAGAAKVMVNGQEKHYAIDDPMLANAILSINMAALNHPVLKTLNAFKRALTHSVVLDPAFKIRNLMRDSIQSIALSELPLNPFANVYNGVRGLRGDARASVTAGGGLFGSQMDERDLAARIKRLADKGVDPKTVLTDPQSVMKALFEGYERIGENLENANRVALYNSMIAQGKTHLEAAFAARDLMDFSLQGRSSAIRMLAMVLPFFNARLQGLYKIGRDGVVPTMLTIMGKADEGQRAKAARFSAVAGAVAMAGILLYLSYRDDRDFQERESWDRDNFWWFKAGGVAYRIPKPFEVGSISTIAERVLEQMVDDKAMGEDFAHSMTDMLVNTFAFDPVPQAFRPLINLVANRDSFTDRPIESMGMQNLSKTERFSAGTSETAKGLSKANQAVAGLLGPLGRDAVLSPAQIDYLARGYFGWLGATIMQSTGQLAKWGDEVESPAATLSDYPVIGSFMKEMPSTHSRYVSEFYKSAEEVKHLYNDIKFAQRLGDYDKARELMAENKEAVQLYTLYNRSSRQISTINQQMRRVESSPTLSAQEKREALDTLSLRKAEIARRVELLRREKKIHQ